MFEGVFGRNPFVSEKLEKLFQQIQSLGVDERWRSGLVRNITPGSKLFTNVFQVDRFDELGAEELFVVLRCRFSYCRCSE
jgi:hypothetical protein